MPEDSPDRLITRIDFERLIGSTYSGMFFAVFASCLEPVWVKSMVESLGPVLSPISVITLGVCWYVVHRYVTGELLIYPLVHALHWVWDRVRKRSGRNSTCTVHYLGAVGVNFGDRRSAYTVLRKRFFSRDSRINFDIAHGECHILFVTAEQLAVAALYLNAQGGSARLVFGMNLLTFLCAGSLFFWMAAILTDIKVHQLECRQLRRAMADGKLHPFLKESGFIT